MRIVLYNFEQPDGAKKIGGGVTVYSSNLMQELERAGHEIIFLSSGARYGLFSRAVRLRTFCRGTERAEIVNSPVFAPAHSTFHNLQPYLDSPALDPIPAQLRAKYGDIDVFHFQNIEGLTFGFLTALRREFPGARLLLSAHNYNIVCPQVNLWFRETRHCDDFAGGRACTTCLPWGSRHRFELNIRRMELLLEWLGVQKRPRLAHAVREVLRVPFRAARGVRAVLNRAKVAGRLPPNAEPELAQAKPFALYRQRNLDLCASVFDEIIAVSQRTRKVLVGAGVPAHKTSVSYIGTAQKSRFDSASKIMSAEAGLHLAYLGYMRRDKGFYFLLECLERMPRDLSSRVAVTIAARVTDNAALKRLKTIAPGFRTLTIHDGYTHDSLDQILAGVNLGVVPVLWEDNLPQVAIEIVARGIPLLTSDRGGAREIAQEPAFTFKSGSRASFFERLAAIADGRTELRQFWNQPTRLLSMQDHVDELMSYYEPDQALESHSA